MPSKLEIPGYELLAYLRPGLHSAREVSTRRPCTVRVLEGVGPDRKARIKETGPALRRLAQANLAGVQHVGLKGDTAWVVEEEVEGPTLEELLAAVGGRLGVGPALALAVQLGRALAALEEADLLHRGVSPANVVICSDGCARLTQLGLSLEAEINERISAGVVPAEAVDYMSPELIEGEPEPTCKGDVYGLGATLFRVLTGRSPYGGTTLITRLRAIWSDEAPDLRALRPDVPDALSRLVASLMERDADDRPLALDVGRQAARLAQQLGADEEGWEERVLAELVAEAGEAAREGGETDVGDLISLGEQQIQIRLRGKDETFSRTLASGEGLEIGRSSEAGVCLPFKWVSRQHAKIERRPEGFLLTDLGSANGSVHNGSRVKGSVLLRTGDVISFGKSNFEITFSRAEPGSSSRITAPTVSTWTECRFCGADLDTAVRSGGSAVCSRCLDRAEADQSAGDERVREALAEVGFEVRQRLPAGGLLKRFRATSKGGEWSLSVAELGPPAAKAFAAASDPARSLAHPYLLPAREVLVQDGTLIVVYEFQPGATLEQTVDERGPIDPRAALHLGSYLADGLAFARGQAITQVLVRPDLVLLDAEGTPSLLHAGLAPGLTEAQRGRVGLTSIEACYEAPELDGGGLMDERAVVYALAATLCYALTGNPVAERRGGERHEHLRLTMVESLPRRIAYLLARATSPDPNDRPKSLESFSKLLIDVADDGTPVGNESEDGTLDEQERTQQINLEDLPPEHRA